MNDDKDRAATAAQLTLDITRAQRIGFDEAIFGRGKSTEQLDEIITQLSAGDGRGLITRLEPAAFAALPVHTRRHLDYDSVSRTAILGMPHKVTAEERIGVITAGTSDVPVALEAVRTLRYYGEVAYESYDCGVAGLWRLLDRVEALRSLSVVIAVAGMDAALPSVVGGLLPGAIIAVPTSTGYGVAAGGTSALHATLASRAPGVVVVNIDNGFGAACAALRMVRAT